MSDINKILRFAKAFGDASAIESFLWGGTPPGTAQPQQAKPQPPQVQAPQPQVSSTIPGYSRLTQTPGTDVQTAAQGILNSIRHQPIGTTAPFSMNGIDYIARLETHSPGPRNPKLHPGISLFVKDQPQAQPQQFQQFQFSGGPVQLSERSKSKIAELDPRFKPLVYRLMMSGLQRGLRPEIVDARRSQEKQNALYEQGRTKPGQIVTWTRESMHTKGLAVDIVQLDEKGNIDWNAPEEFWNAMGQLGKSLGMKWGGDFKNKDRPHFQYVPNTQQEIL